MLLKINNQPLKEILEDGINIKLDFMEAYEIIQTPIHLEVGSNAHHWFTTDLNIFNVPNHIVAFAKPHAVKLLDFIF